MTTFDYTLPYPTLNLRLNPHLYRTGKGEQGVLLCEPYKSELLPLWRFRTPSIATQSSTSLYSQFLAYKSQNDFVGMDMARKFIQMGVTRARRYANHKGGRKYVVDGETGERRELPRQEVEDEEKAESARIFGEVLREVRADEVYVRMLREHKDMYAGEGKKGGRGKGKMGSGKLKGDGSEKDVVHEDMKELEGLEIGKEEEESVREETVKEKEEESKEDGIRSIAKSRAKGTSRPKRKRVKSEEGEGSAASVRRSTRLCKD